jgi:DNA helicase-2/ATP-dependent DNA helicase PcrA
MLYGRTNAAMASRFLKEIPDHYMIKKGGYRQVPEYGYSSSRTAAVMPERKPQYTAYSAPSKPTGYLELNKGDMVEHAAFGKGLVLSVMKMSGDALLEIAFDRIGTKKLMAKTASSHMKKL